MKLNLKELKNGRIFSVTFTKVNGEQRKMTARLGVRKNLKGVGMKYDPIERGNLVVYSMGDRGYRTIKLDNIVELKCNGKIYTNA